MGGVEAPHGPIWYGATVLVVDNEATSRELIRRMLEVKTFTSRRRRAARPRWR